MWDQEVTQEGTRDDNLVPSRHARSSEYSTLKGRCIASLPGRYYYLQYANMEGEGLIMCVTLCLSELTRIMK